MKKSMEFTAVIERVTDVLLTKFKLGEGSLKSMFENHHRKLAKL